ncbi:MAG: choice-of-anchor D domain-containing protein [Candidatus Acidiferrales bacterium]
MFAQKRNARKTQGNTKTSSLPAALWLFACLAFISACGSPASQAANPARTVASVSAVNFGQQQVGTTSSPVLIRLTCSGSKQVNINSIDINGPFGYSGPSLPAKLVCGSVLDLYVTFSPNSVGTVGPNYFTISSNAGNSPQSIPLSGEGTGDTQSASLSVSPTALSFGSQTIGTTSASQPVTLSNTGSTSVTLSSATITGPFLLSGWAGNTTLPAGQSLALQVAFNPATEGNLTGTLSITSNAPSSPNVVSLSGTGTVSSAPLASVSPTSLNFGTQTVGTPSSPQTVTVANAGTADLAISGISITPSVFTISGPAAPVTVAPSQSVSYGVTFTPTASQSYSGQLSFTSNSSGSPHVVSLSGTGATESTSLTVSPASLSFGNQNVNTTSTAQAVTVNNAGAGSVTISGLSITGPFAFTGWSGSTTLLSGQSLALQVTFKPLSEGSFTGTLTITSNAPSSPDKVSVSGSGTTASLGNALCGLLDTGLIQVPLDYISLAPPALGQSIVDAAFGCRITRLSNSAAQFGVDVHHEYSSMSPFNSNNTRILLLTNQGAFYVVDSNGNIIVAPGSLGVSGLNEPRWSMTDPNVFYYHQSNQMKKRNLSDGTTTAVRTFTQYSAINFGGGESDISEDGDHMVIVGDNRFVHVYRISTNTLGPALDLAGNSFDNFDMTANNNVLGNYGSSGTGRFRGIELFDKNMNFLRQVLPYGGHADRGRDINGDEILVITNNNDTSPLAGCAPGMIKVRLSDSQETCLVSFQKATPSGGAWWNTSPHVSVNNSGGHPWALISITDTTRPGTANPNGELPADWATRWGAYYNELFLVKLDGTQAVRLAHHRSRPFPLGGTNYWKIPRAAISRDGSYVLFDSDFALGGSSNYADVYLITGK